jgi:plastocyanin/mono/diheme cytochrome c family protein
MSLVRAAAGVFLLGVLAAVVAALLLAAITVVSGIVDVAARKRAFPDRILAYATLRSIAHHARDERNPLAGDPAALKAGLEHYREMCITCHGAPGTKPAELAAGLHPPAPDLASAPVQAAFTDGMLYRTIANGIGSTGMPAFAKTHPPDDIWKIVAFVRHLPALTPEERAALAKREPGEHEHHPEGGAPPPQPSPEHAHRVSISNFAYAPSTLKAKVGDTVEWKNEDAAVHTATADDRSFDSGDVQPDGTQRIVVKKKGQFPYTCRHHPAMKGTLVVE